MALKQVKEAFGGEFFWKARVAFFSGRGAGGGYAVQEGVLSLQLVGNCLAKLGRKKWKGMSTGADKQGRR